MRLTKLNGRVLIEAKDWELFFDGGVTDVVDGQIMNFYFLSDAAASELQQLLIDMGLKKMCGEKV